MRDMRPAIFLATQVDAYMGRGPVLLGAVPAFARAEWKMTELSLFDSAAVSGASIKWTATREAGLARLQEFLPRAGRAYAKTRNFDYGPMDRSNISCLSPWIRHRLVSEEEVLRSTLEQHGYPAAEKFIQEVFWRTYFKGWLEQRPLVWHRYCDNLDVLVERLKLDARLKHDYDAAVAGKTGITCFDAWVRELVDTGYLHNHTRMWFASIWIFTLRLPWQLGADFFLRNLLDGDPASNTLSWRWVGGLHTKDKTYAARAENIAQFTDGRFNPIGQLAECCEPLTEPDIGPYIALSACEQVPNRPYVLLVSSEDCHSGSLRVPRAPEGVIGYSVGQKYSSLPVSAKVASFTQGAVNDAVKRAATRFSAAVVELGPSNQTVTEFAEQLLDAARSASVDLIVTAYVPTGPVADQFAVIRTVLERSGVTFVQVKRFYDEVTWPHATKGFFRMKKEIPHLLQQVALN